MPKAAMKAVDSHLAKLKDFQRDLSYYWEHSTVPLTETYLVQWREQLKVKLKGLVRCLA